MLWRLLREFFIGAVRSDFCYKGWYLNGVCFLITNPVEPKGVLIINNELELELGHLLGDRAPFEAVNVVAVLGGMAQLGLRVGRNGVSVAVVFQTLSHPAEIHERLLFHRNTL
jgi:hypothetical protein